MEKILWADDEIELLKPHLLFLKQKGYGVTTVSNGRDALDALDSGDYRLVLLDENMPGLSGLETLRQINERHSEVKVIMITKSEEEDIMNQAIGNSIADYLIKPVNPTQIWLSLKKNLQSGELVTAHAESTYRKEYESISEAIGNAESADDWKEVYRRLVFWEMKLSEADSGMDELLLLQKREANAAFCKFVKREYEGWMDSNNRPVMSTDVFRRVVFPLLDKGEKIFFVLIDNLRLDQWKEIQPILADYFTISEELYMSILPTATQFARNALFAGLTPLRIKELYPQWWTDNDDEESLNNHEEELVGTLFERFRRKENYSYTKINDSQTGDRFLQQIKSLRDIRCNILVFNFIDILSHARTESKMMRELANTDAAYRALSASWFRHSSAIDIFRTIAAMGFKIILTTDHGTIRVDNPVKVVGDRNTNTNLRYKVGKNLSYNPKQVFEIYQPGKCGLPSPNVSSKYIFALNEDFFAYPNNYNYYAQYYNGTFQHGGISLQEMLIPLVTLTPK